jgi:hypothetical protein
MRSYYQITAASGLAALAPLTGSTLGQKPFPDNEVPFTGTGVYRAQWSKPRQLHLAIQATFLIQLRRLLLLGGQEQHGGCY